MDDPGPPIPLSYQTPPRPPPLPRVVYSWYAAIVNVLAGIAFAVVDYRDIVDRRSHRGLDFSDVLTVCIIAMIAVWLIGSGAFILWMKSRQLRGLRTYSIFEALGRAVRRVLQDCSSPERPDR